MSAITAMCSGPDSGLRLPGGDRGSRTNNDSIALVMRHI